MFEDEDCFYALTDAMESALYEIDKDLFPVEWIVQKLRVMTRIDQATRGHFPLSKKYEIIDRYKGPYERYGHRTTAELKAILNMPIVQQSGGWIGKDVFGKIASGDAWLIAQHADKDPSFQAKVLSLMTPFFEAGQVDAIDYTYLYDRVHVFGLNQPQRYGSQGGEDAEGVWRPWPCATASGEPATLEDVDKEAARVGMKFSNGDQWSLTEYFRKNNAKKRPDASFDFLPADHPKYEPA